MWKRRRAKLLSTFGCSDLSCSFKGCWIFLPGNDFVDCSFQVDSQACLRLFHIWSISVSVWVSLEDMESVPFKSPLRVQRLSTMLSQNKYAGSGRLWASNSQAAVLSVTFIYSAACILALLWSQPKFSSFAISIFQIFSSFSYVHQLAQDTAASHSLNFDLSSQPRIICLSFQQILAAFWMHIILF